MKIAQNRYIRRKVELSGEGRNTAQLNKLMKEYEILLQNKDKEVFRPKNIVSIEEDHRRKLIKKSKCMGKKLERYFEITKDDNFAYYGKAQDKKPKKQHEVEKINCKIETKDMLNAKEKKTWNDKDAKNYLRVKISVPKGKNKTREVFFYTDSLFEAEYLKLELENELLAAIRDPVHSVNQIFRTNVASNFDQQIMCAPERIMNYASMAAVCETLPDAFSVAMQAFGQKLLEKAKSKLAPKNKWQFDCLGLKQSIDNNKAINRSIKDGSILFTDKGIEFFNKASPSQGFTIEDYDSLHAVSCKKNAHRYDVLFQGRKTKTVGKDDPNIQDPMEEL